MIDIELGDYTRVQVKPAAASQASPVDPAQAVAAVERRVAAAGGDGDDEPAVSAEDMSRLAAEKESQLREETDSVDAGDFYTAAFVSEAAYNAAVHGERLYDGSTCPTCGSSRMVQNGTCKVCMDCGTTTGCS